MEIFEGNLSILGVISFLGDECFFETGFTSFGIADSGAEVFVTEDVEETASFTGKGDVTFFAKADGATNLETLGDN